MGGGSSSEEQKCRETGVLLLRAAEDGDYNSFSEHLENTDYCAACNSYKQTVLHVACEKGDIRMVKLLIIEMKKGSTWELNIDDNSSDYNTTPLIHCSTKGHFDIAQLLVGEGANLNKQNVDGFTAFCESIRNQHFEIAELLLEKGANLDMSRLYKDVDEHELLEIFRSILFWNPKSWNNKSRNFPTSMRLYVGELFLKNIAVLEELKGELLVKAVLDDCDLKKKLGYTDWGDKFLEIFQTYGETLPMVFVVVMNDLLISASLEVLLTIDKLDLESIGETIREKMVLQEDLEMIMIKKNIEVDGVRKNIFEKMFMMLEDELEMINVDDLKMISKKFKIAMLLIENGAHDNHQIEDDKMNEIAHIARSLGTYSPTHRYPITSRILFVKLLLKSGNINVKMQDKDGETLLMYFSKNGELEMTELLLNEGADLYVRNRDGFTALCLSLINGHFHVSELLVNHGDANYPILHNEDDKRNKVFYNACFLANSYSITATLCVAKLLIKSGGIDVNMKNEEGKTPLIHFSTKGEPGMTELLVNSGAETNAKSNVDGQTALMIWSAKGDFRMVKLLVETEAEINIKDFSGFTALTLALRNRNFEIVEFLVQLQGAEDSIQLDDNEKNKIFYGLCFTEFHNSKISTRLCVANLLIKSGGIDVNMKNKEGETPLIYFSKNGNLEMTQLLLNKGGDINLTTDFGNTALMYCSIKGYLNIAQLLVDEGAEIALGNKDGITALMYCSMNGHSRNAEFLVNKGAEINKQDKTGFTALMYCSKNAHFPTAQVLIEKGANVNVEDANNNTPLMHSSANGCYMIVEMLLKNKAEINKQNKHGLTALIQSISNLHFNVTQVLVKNGANNNFQLCFPVERPFNYCISNCSSEAAQCAFKLLLKNGASSKVRYGEDTTCDPPLIHCILNNQIEAAILIIENEPASIHVRTTGDYYTDGCTAIMCSAAKGQLEITELLIKFGADVNAKNYLNGKPTTALMYACTNGHLEIVQLLIKNGADIYARSRGNHKRALYYSQRNSHMAISQLLIQHGA